MNPVDSLTAWKSQKRDSECANKAGGSQSGSESECGNRESKYQVEDLRRHAETQQQGLKRQPFADEAIEWRHRRYRQGTNEKKSAGLRHAPEDAAHLFHVSRSRRVHDGSRPQEKQPLEGRMIQAVIQRGDERQRG